MSPSLRPTCDLKQPVFTSGGLRAIEESPQEQVYTGATSTSLIAEAGDRARAVSTVVTMLH